MSGQTKKSASKKGADFKYLIYEKSDAEKIQTILKDESIWLSRKNMADLFGCSTDNIAFHLKNIFTTGELTEKSVAEQISATAADGKKYLTYFYNLDAIISVGYRINSKRATDFRIWATKVLKDYLIHGYAVDKNRMARDLEYARLIERAEKLRITEQELRAQITKIAREYKLIKKSASSIAQEFKGEDQKVDYGALVRKSLDTEWWDKLGLSVSEFFDHLESLTTDGTELYNYIENIVNQTPFRPLISDFVSDTSKLLSFKNKTKS